MKVNLAKSLLAMIAVLSIGALPVQSNPAPYEIPGAGHDLPKNGPLPNIGNANSPAADFNRLLNLLSLYPSLPTPILNGDRILGTENVTANGLLGFDYAVLHYGAGHGGSPGGGIEIWYLDGAANFNFPANGTGPNGRGGWSSLVLFQGVPSTSAPDGGATALLLGSALMGIRLIRRKLS
jgi:hypothetical protein